ncbi:MAG: DUF4173 domain-containing protein [Bacteroidia bacterium]|nr:DUF4173 domain-containing protein [Bacteroidia bacterium]
MKRNDWLLIATAIIFSVLFYKQGTGLNYLLFTGLVTAVLAYFNPEKIKTGQFWYYAGLSILCGIAVFYVNSNLSVFACILSLFVFSGKTFNYKNSIIVNLVFSVGSLISSVVFVIIDQIQLRKQNVAPANSKKLKIYFGIAIALIISVLFFALYQQANPLFKEFTKNIDLSWISIGWCLFTIWGFLVMYGLIYYRDIPVFTEWDIKFNRTLENTATTNEPKEINNNTIIALSLFGLLNLMLVFVNSLDLINLFGSHELPKGIYLSDFVHNAVWSLIFSIVIAVGLIMWFFKGDLNFNKQSKTLKLLVYFWILQSAVMIVSAMVRNGMYVAEYQLTYLRIGVYVFLSLSLVGLFFTGLKIGKTKSAWYLVRQNFEAWYLLLALCSFVNWDKIISDYNIAHAKTFKALDKSYLVALSNANLPELTTVFFGNKKDGLFNETEQFQKNYDFKQYSWRLYQFMVENKKETWQSFNLRDKTILEKMSVHFKNNVVTHIGLDTWGIVELKNMLTLNKLKVLHLSNTPTDFELIAFFKDIEELSFSNFNGKYLKNLLLNKNLKKFEVTSYYEDVHEFQMFKAFKKLEVLSLPNISNEELMRLDGHPSLKILNITTIYEEQKSFIEKRHLSFEVKEVGYAGR